MAVDLAVVIMLEATLSFLGVGVPLTEPSLGMMVAIGKNYIYAGMWWMIVFPGAALVLLVVGGDQSLCGLAQGGTEPAYRTARLNFVGGKTNARVVESEGVSGQEPEIAESHENRFILTKLAVKRS